MSFLNHPCLHWTGCLLAVLLLGCSREDPTFDIQLDYADPTSPAWFSSRSSAGGVGGASDTAGVLAYAPGGPFSVQITATPTSGSINPRAPGSIRASVSIENAAATASTSTFTTTLVSQTNASDSLSFVGSGALGWPPGGQIRLLLQTAGQLRRESIEMDVPQLEIAQGPRSAAGIAVCVRSTSRSGVVTLHVDNATVGGGSSADATGSLTPGDCPVGYSSDPCADSPGAGGAGAGEANANDPNAAPPLWHTHALMTVVPTSAASSSNLNAVATLQNATFVTGLSKLCLVSLPERDAITVTFEKPKDEAAFAPGDVVDLTVRAEASDKAAEVSVTFQVAGRWGVQQQPPAIVPATVFTKDGSAKASFVMPDLGANGHLVIVALGGTAPSDPLKLSNPSL